MAKIARYAQDQLVSAVVGTAGVDQSGGILGAALGNSADMQAAAVQASNNMMRQESDRIYLANEAFTRQAQAQAFQGIGNEIMRRQAVQRQQDQWDLQQLQLEQRAREKEQRHQLDEVAASNAALKFDMDAAARVKQLRETNTNPDTLADAEAGLMQKLRDEMSKGMNPNVATKFIEHANSRMSSAYQATSKEALSHYTKQVRDDRTLLEDSLADGVKTELDYNRLIGTLNSDEDKKTQYKAWGDQMDTRREKVLDRAAENMLRAYAQKESDPERALRMIDSGKYDRLGETKLQRIRSHAEAAIKVIDKEFDNEQKILHSNTKLKSAAIADHIPPSDYNAMLKARGQIEHLIVEEESRPVYEPGMKKRDPDTGAPIVYQQLDVIKDLEKRRNEIDGKIKAHDAGVVKAAKEAATAQRAERKAGVVGRIEEETNKWASGESTRVELFSAMAALRKAMEKNSKVGMHDKHEIYKTAVGAYEKAQSAGFIDRPGSVTSVGRSIMQELVALGKPLSKTQALDGLYHSFGWKTSSDEITTVMKELNGVAPPAVHNILREWRGKSATDTNYEYMEQMISTYDRFKSKHGGQEPTPATVESWRKTITNGMVSPKVQASKK